MGISDLVKVLMLKLLWKKKKKKKAMKKRSDPVGILSPRALTMGNAPQLAESLGWSGSLSQHHPGLLRMFVFYRREN